MTFQASVPAQIAAGLAGEPAYDGGMYRVRPAVLNSADATLNIVGRGCVIKAGATGTFAVGADPKTMAVAVGEAGVFAGLLVHPKQYAGQGVAGNSLGATLTLPNGTQVSVADEGDWFMSLPAAASPGDVVYLKTADGTFATAAPGAAIPAGCVGPVGTVDRFVSTGAGLSVVHLEPRVPSLIP